MKYTIVLALTCLTRVASADVPATEKYQWAAVMASEIEKICQVPVAVRPTSDGFNVVAGLDKDLACVTPTSGALIASAKEIEPAMTIRKSMVMSHRMLLGDEYVYLSGAAVVRFGRAINRPDVSRETVDNFTRSCPTRKVPRR